MARVVGIRGHLPAAEVDGFQARLHLLHRLIAGEGAECRHIIFMMQQEPEPLRAQPGQGVLHLERAA